MKQCVICGKSIKKKDSVMTNVYVCSDKCKQQRKDSLPKKLSVTSTEYWTNKGLSVSDAKIEVSKQQRLRSKRCTEFWINNGYSEEDAIQKVKEYQSSLGQRNVIKYTYEQRRDRSPFSKEYWKQKGYTEEEASSILSINADNQSLNYFVSKYGETEGKQRYHELCDKRKNEYTLQGFIQQYGETTGKRLWSKKYKNRHNSKKASKFFSLLTESLGNEYKIYTADNENGEYGVLDRKNNVYYFYDYVVPDMNLCVEYNGDYWHCNPSKYSNEYVLTQRNQTAEEIWKHDKIKLECITRERNIQTIIVWESDDPQTKINEILEIINESSKKKNQK